MGRILPSLDSDGTTFKELSLFGETRDLHGAPQVAKIWQFCPLTSCLFAEWSRTLQHMPDNNLIERPIKIMPGRPCRCDELEFVGLTRSRGETCEQEDSHAFTSGSL